jgi:hypothetical protein
LAKSVKQVSVSFISTIPPPGRRGIAGIAPPTEQKIPGSNPARV